MNKLEEFQKKKNGVLEVLTMLTEVVKSGKRIKFQEKEGKVEVVIENEELILKKNKI